MALEIKIPSPGESITEVELTSWFVEDGALVYALGALKNVGVEAMKLVVAGRGDRIQPFVPEKCSGKN